VVTGAASGIGRAIAWSLARRGCGLALVDRNDRGLAETAEGTRALGSSVTTYALDLTDRAAIAALPAAVLAAHSGVDLLINNAGVALGGTFAEVEEDAFDWLFAINFLAVVRMTRAFLPALTGSADARIVNLSSVYGIVSPPGQAAYSASKFAVRGFSQALRHELAGTNVGVTIVHPGGVATAIARNARMPRNADPALTARGIERAEKLLRMPPKRAGEIIVAAVERRRARVLVGTDAQVIALLERLWPVSHMNVILGRVFAR
jgi:short-subunit dehydrogenase